jgi:hypothetical protein
VILVFFNDFVTKIIDNTVEFEFNFIIIRTIHSAVEENRLNTHFIKMPVIQYRSNYSKMMFSVTSFFYNFQKVSNLIFDQSQL